MRIDVELYVAGQTFTETVNATDYQQAKQVALARNPGATVVSINRDFHDDNKSILESNQARNIEEKKNNYTNFSRDGLPYLLRYKDFSYYY